MEIKIIPQIDLFASRLIHHQPKYISWHPYPENRGVDSLQHSWRNLYRYACPPFCLIGKIFAKVRKGWSVLFIITAAWPDSHGTQYYSQYWFNIPQFYPILPYCCKALRGKSTLCRKTTSYSWWHGRFQEDFSWKILCLPAKSKTLRSTSHKVISTGNTSMAEIKWAKTTSSKYISPTSGT